MYLEKSDKAWIHYGRESGMGGMMRWNREYANLWTRHNMEIWLSIVIGQTHKKWTIQDLGIRESMFEKIRKNPSIEP